MAFDFELVFDRGHVSKVLEDGGVRCDSDPSTDEHGHVISVPVLLSSTERAINVQLQKTNREMYLDAFVVTGKYFPANL